jgi:hypothetical protein
MLTLVTIPAGIFIAFDCSNDLTRTPASTGQPRRNHFLPLWNSYSWEKICPSSPFFVVMVCPFRNQRSQRSQCIWNRREFGWQGLALEADALEF